MADQPRAVPKHGLDILLLNGSSARCRPGFGPSSSFGLRRGSLRFTALQRRLEARVGIAPIWRVCRAKNTQFAELLKHYLTLARPTPSPPFISHSVSHRGAGLKPRAALTMSRPNAPAKSGFLDGWLLWVCKAAILPYKYSAILKPSLTGKSPATRFSPLRV